MRRQTDARAKPARPLTGVDERRLGSWRFRPCSRRAALDAASDGRTGEARTPSNRRRRATPRILAIWPVLSSGSPRCGGCGPRWVRYPCIPGHEWSGTVSEVGANVHDLAPGERVVCEGIIPCNRCRRCRAGETNLCANYDQLGFTRGGGYGEFVLAPRHVVHRLPESVSLDAGVLIEP